MYSRIVFIEPSLITAPMLEFSAGSPTVNLFDARLQLVKELVVDALVHDGARTRRALLALETERRLRDAFDGGVEIGIGVDDDGILAAHFEDGALDPDLAGSLRGRDSC